MDIEQFKKLPANVIELRDKFAMAALTGILANGGYKTLMESNNLELAAEFLTSDAYVIADSMFLSRLDIESTFVLVEDPTKT